MPVQPGNWGGALVDERGNVVGVVLLPSSAHKRRSLSVARCLECRLVDQEQLPAWLFGIGASGGRMNFKEPNAKDLKPEEVAEEAKEAAALVSVY